MDRARLGRQLLSQSDLYISPELSDELGDLDGLAAFNEAFDCITAGRFGRVKEGLCAWTPGLERIYRVIPAPMNALVITTVIAEMELL